MSDYTAPLVELLPPSVRAIRYQQRGLPPSTLDGPFDVETHVADALGVLDERGVDRAWLVGHSWGGHLAFHIAVAHPERVCWDSSPSPRWAPRLRTAAGATSTPTSSPASNATRPTTRRGPGSSMSARWPARPPMRRPASRSASCGLTTSRTRSRRHRCANGPAACRSTQESSPPSTISSSAELWSEAAGVHQPFAIVHGEEDPLPIEASRATAALVPQAVLEPIADAGHFLWFEQPDALRAALARVGPG